MDRRLRLVCGRPPRHRKPRVGRHTLCSRPPRPEHVREWFSSLATGVGRTNPPPFLPLCCHVHYIHSILSMTLMTISHSYPFLAFFFFYVSVCHITFHALHLCISSDPFAGLTFFIRIIIITSSEQSGSSCCTGWLDLLSWFFYSGGHRKSGNRWRIDWISF